MRNCSSRVHARLTLDNWWYHCSDAHAPSSVCVYMWFSFYFIFSSSFLSFLSLPLSFLSLVISLLSLSVCLNFFSSLLLSHFSLPPSLSSISSFFSFSLFLFFISSLFILSFFYPCVSSVSLIPFSFSSLSSFSRSPLSLIIFLLPPSTSISAFIFMVRFPLCQLLTLCVHTFACDGRTQNDAHLIVCYSSFVFHSVNSGTFRGINIPIMVITMVTFYCQCNPRCMAPRNRKHLLFANNDSTAISDTIKRDLLLA